MGFCVRRLQMQIEEAFSSGGRSPFPPFFRFRRRPRGGEERKSHGRKKGFSTRASGAKARGEAFMCSIFPPSVLHFKAEGASAARLRRRRRGFFSLCTSGNVSSICTLSSSQNRISSLPRQARHGAQLLVTPFLCRREKWPF